jgi:uncharacterized protein (TIGR00251 family)
VSRRGPGGEGTARDPERRERPDGPGRGHPAAALDLRDSAEGLILRVRAQPRASRDALAGEREGALVVRLTAPPVGGAANEALARLLARALGVAPSAVRILSGAASRQKRVAVAGVDAVSARERLGSRMAG